MFSIWFWLAYTSAFDFWNLGFKLSGVVWCGS